MQKKKRNQHGKNKNKKNMGAIKNNKSKYWDKTLKNIIN